MPLRSTVAVLGLALSSSAQLADGFRPVLAETDQVSLDVAVGDVNGDGLLDLASGFAGPVGQAGVRLALGLPGDRFGTFATVAGARGETLLVDLDGDGRADLVQAELFGSRLVARRSLGDGSFAPLHSSSTGQRPQDPRVADMDGDGLLDVVAVCDQRLAVALGTGTAELLADAALLSGPVGPGAAHCAVGDVNGDGVLDAVAASVTNDLTEVLLGLGDGKLEPANSFAATDTPRGVELGDLDLDGELDLLVFAGEALRARGGAGHGFGVARITPVPGSEPDDLALVDMDEDGLLDVILSELGTHVLLVAGGRGDLSFDVRGELGAMASAQWLDVADLNADGDLDLVSAGVSDSQVLVLHGEGDGTVRGVVRSVWGPRALAVGDLDLDGWPDLATTVRSLGSSPKAGLTILRNAAGNLELSHYEPDANPGHRELAIGDFDGDALPDVLSVAGAFYAGQGDATVADPVQVSLTPFHLLLDTADLDGDGRLDVVTSQSGPLLRISFGLGDGTFTFPVSLSSSLGGIQEGFVLEDLTGDGHVDILVQLSHQGDTLGTLVLFVGAGDGTFVESVQSPSLPQGRDLALADIDGDGILDAVAGLFPAHVMVHRGLGVGAFASPQVYDVRDWPSAVAVDDLDGDGHLDVVVTCIESGSGPNSDEDPSSVCLLRGDGTGALAPAECLVTGSSAADVLAEDLDLDGMPELLVASAGSYHVAVFANLAGPWRALPHGLPGTHGIPRLRGSGSLQTGQPFAVTLDDAAPAQLAWLVIGLAEGLVPFKGGTLVPELGSAGGLVSPWLVGADGTARVESNWPAGVPSGLQTWWQGWVADEGAALGFAASNGLVATAP